MVHAPRRVDTGPIEVKARKASPKARAKRAAQPITWRSVLGWVFLIGFAGSLLSAAGAALTAGLPYYLTPEWARPDHPLDETFAPGAVVGLLLGIVGALLMGLLLLYSLRKWLPFTSFMGTPRFWMRFHLTCGLLGPAFVVLHAAIATPSGFIGVGFWVMLLVAASGFFGRYLFGYLPAGAHGRRLDLDEAQRQLADLRERLVIETRGERSGLVADAVGLARDFDKEAESLLGLLFVDAEIRMRMDRIRVLLHRADLDADMRRKAERTLSTQLSIRRSIAGFEVARRLLRWWYLLHQPMALGMYAIVSLHVLNAVLFGGVVRIIIEGLGGSI